MRGSLTKYLKILLDDDGACCFYCAATFSRDNPPAVDHVIPWSFLLEDPIWDLVPACTRCNSAKSDWLPAPEYIERLAARNARHEKALVGEKVGLLVSVGDLHGLFDAAVSVEWPRFWTP